MAHADYIAAAKQANRQPVCYMQIEQADSQVLYYTSQGDWAGSTVLTRVDTASSPDDILNQYLKPFTNDVAGTFLFNSITSAADVEAFGRSITAAGVSVQITFTLGIGASGATTFNATTRLKFDVNGSITYSNTSIDNYISATTAALGGDTYQTSSVAYNTPVYVIPADIPIAALDTVIVSLDVVSVTGIRNSGVNGTFQSVDTEEVETLSTGLLAIPTTGSECLFTTSDIDFGAVPTGEVVFSTDDITDPGCSIVYSAFGGPTSPPANDLGTIVDGDTLTSYQYYRITGKMASSAGGQCKVREIQLSEGIFVHYGTHIDLPFQGIQPYIDKNSVSTLNQKVQIGRGLSTVGESSVKLLWTDDTANLIASGYLKGKDVAIFSGFTNISTEAFEPILTGTWYDHDLDEVNRIITVKIRDAFKQFEKREVPQEVVDNVDGSIDTATLTYTTESLITVMLDIFDKINLRDRYIHPDFYTLEAGDYAATKYNVSRTMLKPEDSAKLLDQLAVTGSLYLIPLGNGQIKPKPFDINQEHTAELDAFEINFTNLKGNISEFFSRFYAYYNPKTTLTSDPTKSDDFDNGTAILDATAELRWFPEKGVKNHLDLWKTGRTAAATPLTVPPQALIDLLTLWNSLFTEPLYTVTAKKVPPRYVNIEPADVVQVDNLQLPVVNNKWNSGAIYGGKSKSILAEVALVKDTWISGDGFKMYALDNTTDTIYQYSLSTAWDISTASYDSKSKSVTTEDNSPRSFVLNSDGTKMFYIGLQNRSIYQYTLSTAWDISTASYDSISQSVTGESILDPDGMWIGNGGDKLYVLDSGAQFDVSQYTMTTPNDLSTLTYDNKSKVVFSESTAPRGIAFSDDGRSMYVVGQTFRNVFKYDISVAFDVSTATYNGEFVSIAANETVPTAINFSRDGLEFYVTGTTNDTIFQYSMPNAFEIMGETYDEGDKVISGGLMWRSRVGSNTGNDPVSEAAFWQDMQITDEGLTIGKHFFVIGRKLNPNTALIELDLMEMPPGTIGAYSSAFSSAFDV